MTWTPSSWQQWSSDESRERVLNWQPSADWSSSDRTRDHSEWGSSGSLAVTVLMAVKNEFPTFEDSSPGHP